MLLLTDHLEYRTLTVDYIKKIAPSLKIIVDTRQLLDPDEVGSRGIRYLGVGKP
jgi:UDP-N-acetyl-D-mannosaminuronate dehydrogenase